MSYQRLYPQRINWEDEPSLATPINQVNLNKMDSALYGIDGRVVELDENKVGKNDTFNTSRNGVVPKPTQADITNEKVLRADGVWVVQSGGGGGGGGHIYVDKDDNQMQPRGKAKFTGGLNLTDDSENNRTIVDDNYEIIPWTTWQGYSDAEKAEHPNAIITNAPDCDGTLEIENMHLAWENPDPTSTFGAQQILLDTDTDWDFARVYPSYSNSSPSKYVPYVEMEKGTNGQLNCATSSTYGVADLYRNMSVDDDTHISFGGCAVKDMSQSAVELNQFLIPIKIYTYKKKLTAKIKAVAHDVSTLASNCMMSDEQTSVEDALSYSTTEHVVGKWIDGSTLYEKTVDCGALPNTTSKSVAHNISNIDKIVYLSGIAYAGTNSYPLPFVQVSRGTVQGIRINASSTNVVIVSSYDVSSLTNSYITLRYTKTS